MEVKLHSFFDLNSVLYKWCESFCLMLNHFKLLLQLQSLSPLHYVQCSKTWNLNYQFMFLPFRILNCKSHTILNLIAYWQDTWQVAVRIYFVALKRISWHQEESFLKERMVTEKNWRCFFILREFLEVVFVCIVRAEHFSCKSQPQCIHFSVCALLYFQKSERICIVWNNVLLAGD